MVKNKHGGNRHKKMASKNAKPQTFNRKVRFAKSEQEIYAKVEKTIIEGAIFYDYSNLESQIQQNEKERELIISQLKDAKKGGAKTQPAPVEDKRYLVCETIDLVDVNE